MSEPRYCQSRWHMALPVLSGLLAALHVLLAVAYAVPALSMRTLVRGASTSPVVSYIDSLGLGLVWTGLFGITGLALALALALRSDQVLRVVHSVAVGTMGAWSIALWLGAAASTPRGPIVGALLATVVTVVHWLWAWVYGDQETGR